jgi:hypothetical protein
LVLGVQGSGFRVQGSGFRVQGLGLRDYFEEPRGRVDARGEGVLDLVEGS